MFVSAAAAGLSQISAPASAATQATYYVAPDGNDANPGTITSPFRTLQRARDVVRTVNANMTGDIYVYLRGGNYPVSSTIEFGPATPARTATGSSTPRTRTRRRSSTAAFR